MRIARWLAALGALVAVVVGVWAAMRLRQTQQQVARAVTPVAVPLHALFAPDAHLVVTVRGFDDAYGEFRGLWDDFDDTAAWWQLRRLWDEDRAALPAAVTDALTSLDRDLGEAERRLGHRPTTAEFFEVYGRESAFALVPAAAGRPRSVACTRLPDQARADALTGTLTTVPALRRLPDAPHGYPCFEEPLDDGARRLFAVAGGFLLVSDDADALRASLDRLAAWAAPADPSKPPPPSLHGDAVLARVTGGGDPPALTCWVRRTQGFAGADADLAVVDALVDRAFVLAPDDPAVALALARPGPGRWVLRASFLDRPTRPFTELLPEGLAQLQLSMPNVEAGTAAARAQLDRVLGQPLWREIDALASDLPQLTRLCEEAFSPETRPPAEVLQRLRHDARLLGRLGRALADELTTVAGGELAIATKHYRDPDATEQAFGCTLGAELAFLLAGGLDLVAEKFPDWVAPRHPAVGADTGTAATVAAIADRRRLVWRTGLARVLAEARRGAPASFDPMAGVAPVVILVGRQLVVCTGPRMADEVLALVEGKTDATPIAQDPIFRDATAELPPGAVSLDYLRPAEAYGGGWRTLRQMVDAASAEGGLSPEARDVLDALYATVEAGFDWAAARRASATATYAGGDLPAVTRHLIDADREAKAPAFEGPPGPMEILGWLPAGTWWVHAGQTRPRQAYDELRRVFLEALPGGEDRFRALRSKAGLDGEEHQSLVDACVGGLLRNLDGAAGLAVASPPPLAPDVPPQDPNAMLAQAPAVIAFARFADVDAAWKAIRTLLGQLDRALNPEPFDVRLRRAQEGLEPPPLGARLVEGEVQGVPVLALDLLIPLGGDQPYLVPSLCCLRRGQVVAITQSVPVWQQMLGQADGGEGSLAARLGAALPAEAVPATVGTLALWRGDGLVDHVQQVLQGWAPQLVPLSLGAFRRRPPQDRIDAHASGWRRAIALVCDCFRDPAWQVTHDARQGHTVVVSTRRHRDR